MTGQVHVEVVELGVTVHGAFRQLTTGAVPHGWGVRGNWAYEKFDTSTDVVVIWPDCGGPKIDSPLSTTLHWHFADTVCLPPGGGGLGIQSAIVHKEYGPLHRK